MKRIIKLSFFTTLSVMFTFVLIFITPVHAKDYIEADWEHDPLIKVENAKPGDTVEKNVRVRNKSDDESADLYLRMTVRADEDLADQLNFMVQDESSKNYFVGGPGNRITLEKFDRKQDVFIEELGPGGSNKYTIKLEFDKEAGNEYQDRETKFDIQFELVSNVADGADGSSDELLLTSAGSARTLSGDGENNGNSEGSNNLNPDGEVNGAETNGENIENKDGAVAGVDTECTSWPPLAWLALIALHFSLYNIKQYVKNKNILKHATLIQIGSLVGSLVLWYIFNPCHNILWVPIIIIVTAVASSLFTSDEPVKK